MVGIIGGASYGVYLEYQHYQNKYKGNSSENGENNGGGNSANRPEQNPDTQPDSPSGNQPDSNPPVNPEPPKQENLTMEQIDDTYIQKYLSTLIEIIPEKTVEKITDDFIVLHAANGLLANGQKATATDIATFIMKYYGRADVAFEPQFYEKNGFSFHIMQDGNQYSSDYKTSLVPTSKLEYVSMKKQDNEVIVTYQDKKLVQVAPPKWKQAGTVEITLLLENERLLIQKIGYQK